MFQTFVYQEDYEKGYSGWVLKAKPYFDPMGGLGVAHDLLEEAPHGGEQPHDELLALGAFMWGRGAHFRTMHSPPLPESVKGDICEIYRHLCQESGYFMQKAPTTKPLQEDTYYGLETQIQEVARLVDQAIPEWMKHDLYSHDENDADTISMLRSYRNDIVGWLRMGVRRARRRFYPHMDGYDIAYLADRIAKDVDKIRWAELGDELRMRVLPSRNDFKMYHVPAYTLPEYRDY